MDKFDWFIKKDLKIKYYFRYADDFVIVHSDPLYLKKIICPIENFLNAKLDLKLHPQKVQIRKFRQGIDFLGYVVLPHYTTLRTKTKKRMFKRIGFNKIMLDKGLMSEDGFNQSLQSYYGMLKHCSGHKLKLKINKSIKND